MKLSDSYFSLPTDQRGGNGPRLDEGATDEFQLKGEISRYIRVRIAAASHHQINFPLRPAARRAAGRVHRPGAVIRFPGSRAGAGLCRSTEPRFTAVYYRKIARAAARAVPSLVTAIKPTRYQRLLADDMIGARV